MNDDVDNMLRTIAPAIRDLSHESGERLRRFLDGSDGRYPNGVDAHFVYDLRGFAFPSVDVFIVAVSINIDSALAFAKYMDEVWTQS